MTFEQFFDSCGNEEIFFPCARIEEPSIAAFKLLVHNPRMRHSSLTPGFNMLQIRRIIFSLMNPLAEIP